MTTKKINLKLVGVALLPALAVSVVAILLGKAVGTSEAVAERVSQILFFPRLSRSLLRLAPPLRSRCLAVTG